jgi:DHA2 family multidrug resistance protein
MLLSGLPAFLLMPVLPKLLYLYDTRLMVVIGLILFCISCLLDITLTTDSVGQDFHVSQVLRGFGQILAMMPLNQASMAAVSADEAGDAAGLYNMARNLGGSIGLALIGVMIDRRESLHEAVIRESLTANSTFGQSYMTEQAASFQQQAGDSALAQLQASAHLTADMARQASVMTFNECFLLLGISLAVCIPLAFLLKPAPVMSSAR